MTNIRFHCLCNSSFDIILVQDDGKSGGYRWCRSERIMVSFSRIVALLTESLLFFFDGVTHARSMPHIHFVSETCDRSACFSRIGSRSNAVGIR